jgi:hypothetical protein
MRVNIDTETFNDNGDAVIAAQGTVLEKEHYPLGNGFEQWSIIVKTAFATFRAIFKRESNTSTTRVLNNQLMAGSKISFVGRIVGDGVISFDSFHEIVPPKIDNSLGLFGHTFDSNLQNEIHKLKTTHAY